MEEEVPSQVPQIGSRLPRPDVPMSVPYRYHLSEYQASYIELVVRLGPADGALVWLDHSVSLLAADVKGDVTRPSGLVSVRRRCFYTVQSGTKRDGTPRYTKRYLNQWVTGPTPEAVKEAERRGLIPGLPLQSFVHFNIRLCAMGSIVREDTSRTVQYPDGSVRDERLVSMNRLGPCIAAYARGRLKKGRRAGTERPIPGKWEALQGLAVHLGLIGSEVTPQKLRIRLLRAYRRNRPSF